MNIQKKLFFVLALLLPIAKTNAQQTNEDIKIGQVISTSYGKVTSIFLPPVYKKPDVKSSDDRSKYESTEYVGNSINVSIDFMKSATIISESNDEITYLLLISSPNAVALDIGFSDFTLPDETELFFENQSRDTIYAHYAGPFVKNDEKYFDSKIITSNECFLRLKIKKEALANCQLFIGRITQSFKAWWKRTSMKSASEECIFDVACYSDYTKWINEINSTVYITFTYYDAEGRQHIVRATGVFVNVVGNYAPQSYPFLLTAAHLTEWDTHFDNWWYTLHYQKNVCNSYFSDVDIKSGLKLTYRPPWSGVTDFPHDYLILQANETTGTLMQYNVAYAGWHAKHDYSSIDSASKAPYVCFHHPNYSNNDKQYFIANNKPVSQGGYWDMSINTGYTVKGSSGAGVFSKDHKLIGINVAGIGTCAYPRQETNAIVPLMEIAKIPCFKNIFGLGNFAYTFNPNYTNLPEQCVNCMQDENEPGIDCGGPCRPCSDVQDQNLFYADNLPVEAKSKQNIIVDGSANNITLKSGQSSTLYATGKIKISGNFHSEPGAKLKAGCREFYTTEDRGCKDLCAPILPNVFTPNGDGLSDIYTITAPNGTYYKFTAYEDERKIFYREDFIHSNHPVEIWDGSGRRHSDGIIYAHLELNDCPHGLAYSNNYFFYYYTVIPKSDLMADIQNCKSENEIEVFPNPSSGIVYIQIPHNLHLPVDIELTDIKGTLLNTKSYNTSAIILNLSGYTKGAYIIRMITSEKNVIKKIIVQ